MPIPAKVPTGKEIWGRLPNETSKAYACFMFYLKLSPFLRTVERAYKLKELIPEETIIEVPVMWRRWCSKFEWIKRALAYDELKAQEDLAKWETRREAARERDWSQAEVLRGIVDGALPTATQFYRRQVGQPQGGTPSIVNEAGVVIRQGVPAQVVVTVAFDVVGMTSVLREASKMQRLTFNESTDNINNLTGPALDAALQRALAQLALEGLPDSDEAGDAQGGYEEDSSYEDVDEDYDGGADG